MARYAERDRHSIRTTALRTRTSASRRSRSASKGPRAKAVYSIPFRILRDGYLALIEAFHVVNKVEGEQLEMFRKYGVDLEGRSGKKHHVIAVPALFLIDQQGVVRWALRSDVHRSPDDCADPGSHRRSSPAMSRRIGVDYRRGSRP